jgi:Ribosomal protein L4/L1 family
VLTAGTNTNLYLSGRNLPTVEVLPYAEASAYDILWSDAVVVEEGALTGVMPEPLPDDLEAEETPKAPKAKRAAAPKPPKAAKPAKAKSPKKSAAKPAAKAKAAKKTTAKKAAGKPAKKAEPKPKPKKKKGGR